MKRVRSLSCRHCPAEVVLFDFALSTNRVLPRSPSDGIPKDPRWSKSLARYFPIIRSVKGRKVVTRESDFNLRRTNFFLSLLRPLSHLFDWNTLKYAFHTTLSASSTWIRIEAIATSCSETLIESILRATLSDRLEFRPTFASPAIIASLSHRQRISTAIESSGTGLEFTFADRLIALASLVCLGLFSVAAAELLEVEGTGSEVEGAGSASKFEGVEPLFDEADEAFEVC